MHYIKEIVQKADPTYEALINCFEQIKRNGDVGVIKFDGERKINCYTVFISFPNSPQKEIIRADGDNLKVALIKVLDIYSR